MERCIVRSCEKVAFAMYARKGAIFPKMDWKNEKLRNYCMKSCQFEGMKQESIFLPEVAPVRNREISNAA